MCIQKSLLLFRFAPCGKQSSDMSKAPEISFAPLLRSSSISEGDFQASPSLGAQTGGRDESGDARPGQTQPSSPQVPNSTSSEYNRQESLSSQPASPSTFARKAPFSRSRLRLLSFRSIEEPGMTPSVKDRYPILKHILNFMKDQALSTAR